VWSETTTAFASLVDLSVLSRLVNLQGISDLALQAIVFLAFLYMAYCTYAALFKLRLFNYYQLISQQQTDSNSLLFSAAYLSRLTAPLCYNFLILVRSTDSAFARVMGQIQYVPLFGRQFNEIAPIVIVIIGLFTLFSLYDRVRRFSHVSPLLSLSLVVGWPVNGGGVAVECCRFCCVCACRSSSSTRTLSIRTSMRGGTCSRPSERVVPRRTLPLCPLQSVPHAPTYE
jgi:hypothetical protein